MSLILYRWNGETNLFKDSIAIEDESGIFPAFCTDQKPPEVSGTEVAYWEGSEWVVLPEIPFRPIEVVQSLTEYHYESAVQSLLDESAKARGYDSIATAISYAEEPVVPKFQNDGKAFRAWRSLVWAYAYEQLAAVKAAEREQPTVEDFLLELPALELPA